MAKIQLVGAGPGSPELLTVAAYRALQTADVVLADRLTPPAILKLIKGKICIAQKIKGKADLAQAQLDAWGLEALKKGQHVVRLKNGDPFMFGRGGEEVVVYRQHGYEPEIIPGISSCLAAPASACIPATLRDVADQYLVMTAHGKHDRYVEFPEYVDHRTVVLLMAMGRLKMIVEQLKEKGYPSNLPVAVVQKATMPDQEMVKGSLSNICELVEEAELKPPSTVIIGKVVSALDSRSGALQSKYEISYKPLEDPIVAPKQCNSKTSSHDVIKTKSKVLVYPKLLAMSIAMIPFYLLVFLFMHSPVTL